MSAAGRQVICGVNAVQELIRAGRRPVHELHATSEARGRHGFLADATQADRDQLDAMSDGERHQGVVAVAGPYPYVEPDALLADQTGPTPLIIALDSITDPHNVGAVARICDAVGAQGLIIPKDRSCDVTSAVARASAGAVEHIRIAKCTNLADTLEQMKSAEWWVFAADQLAEGEYPQQMDPGTSTVLVMGAEGSGIRPRVRKTCDGVVTLPMLGKVESLNVSTACAALAYQMVA